MMRTISSAGRFGSTNCRQCRTEGLRLGATAEMTTGADREAQKCAHSRKGLPQLIGGVCSFAPNEKLQHPR